MQNSIFNIKTEADFLAQALDCFYFQYENVEVYRKFVDYLRVDPSIVDSIEKIPFLPIEMYKNHVVLNQNIQPKQYFQSSGTTQVNLSKHFIADFSYYEESIIKSFQQFVGPAEDYIFLGLLPSYLERDNSSLIYMVNFLMQQSAKPENGYFLYNHQDLINVLNQNTTRKIILFGVSFALLDFLDSVQHEDKIIIYNDQLIVIETGGMKGRKEEMTKDELLHVLKQGFSTENIFSEYSMTELLSQAYSTGENIYNCPNWMRILIRNTEDPLSYMPTNRNGAINIIDLANRHSCSFIATQDLGRTITQNKPELLSPSFQVLGRIDHSDIRGCSLLVS